MILSSRKGLECSLPDATGCICHSARGVRPHRRGHPSTPHPHMFWMWHSPKSGRRPGTAELSGEMGQPRASATWRSQAGRVWPPRREPGDTGVRKMGRLRARPLPGRAADNPVVLGLPEFTRLPASPSGGDGGRGSTREGPWPGDQVRQAGSGTALSQDPMPTAPQSITRDLGLTQPHLPTRSPFQEFKNKNQYNSGEC